MSKKLKKFSIDGKYLNQDSFKYLPKSIEKLTFRTVTNIINDNNIKDICLCKYLTKVTLCCFENISNDGMIYLFKNCQHIRKLWLSNSNLLDSSLVYLSPNLTKISLIQCLYLPK